MAHNDEDYLPPLEPPPVLSALEIRHLAVNGWLPLNLNDEFCLALRSLSDASAAFFERDVETKKALYSPAGGTELGFYHVPLEKEFLTLRHQVHSETSLEHCASAVWSMAGKLLYRILTDLSRAGGFSVHAWDHLVADSLTLPKKPSTGVVNNEIPTLLRLFQYYPGGGFAAEHVDLGMLTLCIGQGQGLQVLGRTLDPPRWIDADRPTVVVGDFLRALLRNRIRAGSHRVVSNPEGRTSTIFALRPCLKYETDLSTFGGSGVINTRDYYGKLKSSKYNINCTQDLRERQKLKQKEQEGLVSLASGHG